MPLEKKYIAVIGIIIILVIGGGIAYWYMTAPKKVTIVVEYGQPWQYLVENLTLAKFKEEAKKLGYDVEVTLRMIPYGVDIVQTISQDLAQGVAGDVLVIDSFMIPEYAEAGYLLDLTSYVEEWDGWAAYPEAMKKIVTYENKVYGIMIDTDVRMLWYRKDIFQLAGLPADWQPTTWEDIIEAALTLANNSDTIKDQLNITEFYPIYFPAGTKWGEATTMQGFYMLLLGADKDPYNRLYDYSENKWVGKSKALLRAFQFYYDIYVEHKIAPEEYNFVTDVWSKHREAFAKGWVAIDIGGSWEWDEGWGPNGIYPIPNREEKVGYAKMPGYAGGAESERPFVTISGGWAVAINAAIKPELKPLAWLFVKILASKENVAKFCARYGKIAPRTDAAEVPEYAENEYLQSVLEYLNFTDFRDAMPGYSKVSFYIQQATEKIVTEGWTAEQALDWYYDQLVAEFGEDNVITYPLP